MKMQTNGILLTIVVSFVVLYEVTAAEAVDRERENMIRKRIFCNYIGCHNRKRSQSNPDDVVGLINRNDMVSKDSLVNLQDPSEGKPSLFDSQWPAADDFSRGSDDRDYVARPEDDVNSTREKMAKIAAVLRALEGNLRQRYHSIKRRQVAPGSRQ